MVDDCNGTTDRQHRVTNGMVPAKALQRGTQTPAPKGAQVIPFPAASRISLVQRIAARMANLSRKSAEGHLRRQLTIQAETMRRRGVDEHEIEREMRALQGAVRAALWRCVLLTDRTPPELG